MKSLLPDDPARIGKYELEGRLGSGGMGVVYLGRTPGGRPVAVKVLGRGIASDVEPLERFRREVEILSQVHSPFTAALIDADLSAPPYWFAAEYVPGPTLAESVRRNGPLPTGKCLSLMAALAEGLGDVHSRGICHRDLKPHNVILSPTGPQLIDFGVARSHAQSRLTETGITVGTPNYTAPELLMDEDLSPAADIFSLGATLAFAATGRRPYGEGTMETVWIRLISEAVDLDGVQPELAELIRACVARDPQARPTGEHLIARCRAIGGGDLTGTAVRVREPAKATPPPPRARHKRASRRRALAIVAAAVLLLAVGTAAAIRYTVPGPDTAPAAQASFAYATVAPFPIDQASPLTIVSSAPSETAIPSASSAPPPKTRSASPEPSPTTGTKATTPTTVTSIDGRCIMMPADMVNGAKVSASRCVGSAGQRWTFTREGALRFAGNPQMCLDIGANGGADLGNLIQLWDCNYGGAQLWVPQTDGSLFNAAAGRCLGILPDRGSPLALQSCTGAKSQLWRYP